MTYQDWLVTRENNQLRMKTYRKLTHTRHYSTDPVRWHLTTLLLLISSPLSSLFPRFEASLADALLDRHTIFPPQRWGGKVAWRAKRGATRSRSRAPAPAPDFPFPSLFQTPVIIIEMTGLFYFCPTTWDCPLQNWKFIQNQPLLRKIFKNTPIISYKRGQKYKDSVHKNVHHITQWTVQACHFYYYLCWVIQTGPVTDVKPQN